MRRLDGCEECKMTSRQEFTRTNEAFWMRKEFPAALGSNAIDPMTVILVALLSIIAVEAIMFIIAKISMTARRMEDRV